jgi:hypothetical protein
MPTFVAALHAATLTAAHRHGYEEHHKHNGDRDHDHDDSSRYRRNWDHQGVANHFVSSKFPIGRLPDAARREPAEKQALALPDVGDLQRPIGFRS